jgi:Carboxypeptidase regulatory-like domain
MLSIFKPIHLVRLLFTSALLSILVACGGGGSGNNNGNPPAPATKLAGVIQDSAGAPIAGAAVAAAGQNVVTGSDGSYAFSLDAATTATVVLVKKSGFATTAKEAPIGSGRTTQINIKLFADQVSRTFSAASAASIAVNGATLQIPANSLKFADGGDYIGTVVIGASYYSPDTVQGVQAFAGPYLGLDTGVQSPIISMGFMEVKLSDPSGSPLQLKISSPATLTFPPSSNSANTASVPLWFYDETAKLWRREGQAALQPNGSYQGSVAHFSIWNADFKGVTAEIKTCFVDASGKPIGNVGGLGLRGTGYDHVLFGVVTADNNVDIQRVPANMPLELYSTTSPAGFMPVAIPALAPGEVRQLSCITATPPSNLTTVIFGLPTIIFSPPSTNTATAAFAGTYIGSYSGAESGTFNVQVNSSGVVIGQAVSTTFPGLISGVSGQVSASGGISLKSTAGTAGSASFTGTISSTGAVSGTWAYSTGSLTGGGTFTGQRQ